MEYVAGGVWVRAVMVSAQVEALLRERPLLRLGAAPAMPAWCGEEEEQVWGMPV